MPDAPRRTPDLHLLTPAQRKVLAHIAGYCGRHGHMTQTTRDMAEATGLSRYTVIVAIDRLNELQYIYTLTGQGRKPSRHKLLVSVAGLTDFGLIRPRIDKIAPKSNKFRTVPPDEEDRSAAEHSACRQAAFAPAAGGAR